MDVPEIGDSQLLARQIATVVTETVRGRVIAAHHAQARRFGCSDRLNSIISNRDIRSYAHLGAAAKAILNQAAKKFELSTRAYLRSVKVARTIADLVNSEKIGPQRTAETLQYRPHAYHDE